MIIKINKHGNLKIFRGDKFKTMFCPYSNSEAYCGDWCALFGEPDYDEEDYEGLSIGALKICEKILIGEISDERGRE